MTRIYVVRHGEAAGNRERFFQGHMDGRISEQGREQLKALARRFEQIKLDALYSSPLSRAVETAAAVNSGSGVPVRTDERLLEINGGVLEGVKWADIPERFPLDAERWSLRPWEFSPEGGEFMPDVAERMYRAILDIAEAHEGETVGVVSHGCAIRALLCLVLYGDILRLSEVDWCDNTGVSLLMCENGKLNAEWLNDNSHLEESLSTFASQRWWRPEERDKMVFDD